MRIKSGDTVIVIAGKEKGKTGKVLRTLPKENKIIVEGLNMVTKHMQMRGPNMPSGIQTMEAPIHASNVMYYDGNTRSRIGYKIEDGKKVRVAKATDKTID